MNEKEVAELRRQLRAQKSNISGVQGCCVNERGEITGRFSQSFLSMTEEETDELLGVLRKVLSGGLGRNLYDVAFPNNDVLHGTEHQRLTLLRDSELKDNEALESLYEAIAASVSLDCRYLILLASERYDVFRRHRDGSAEEDSSSVFRYIICAICPIKQGKAALGFTGESSPFRNIAAGSVVGAPEAGFLFPAFDDRAANIYNALFYTRDTGRDCSTFMEQVFHVEPPMPAGVQKTTFRSVLTEAMEDACTMEVAEAVREQLSDLMEEHKASREREPLLISKDVISGVLRDCDVEEAKVENFSRRYDEEFGVGTEVPPRNLIDPGKYTLQTPDVDIRVNPQRPDLVTVRVIDGVKYILVRADQDVTLNGMNISIT